jgi:hypothetical protein
MNKSLDAFTQVLLNHSMLSTNVAQLEGGFG